MVGSNKSNSSRQFTLCTSSALRGKGTTSNVWLAFAGTLGCPETISSSYIRRQGPAARAILPSIRKSRNSLMTSWWYYRTCRGHALLLGGSPTLVANAPCLLFWQAQVHSHTAAGFHDTWMQLRVIPSPLSFPIPCALISAFLLSFIVSRIL